MAKPGTTTTILNEGGVYVSTVDGITGKLGQYEESMRKQVEEGLRDCAGELMDRAVKLTPAVTGELRARSFKTDVMEGEKGSLEIYVGFEQNGAKTGTINGKTAGKFYAVPVHERTEAHHEVGQAKFLEAARNEFAEEFLEAMEKYVEKAEEGA